MPPRNVPDIPDTIKRAIYTPIYEELSQLKKTTTQKDLANMLNVNVTTVGNILNGSIEKVSMNRLIPIASQLGIEMSVTTTSEGVDTVTKLTK